MLPYQISCRSVKLLRRYGDLTVFLNGGRRHLGFWKFEKFNRRYRPEGQYAPSCKISSKSVKRLRRNRDFSIFQDGGRPTYNSLHSVRVVIYISTNCALCTLCTLLRSIYVCYKLDYYLICALVVTSCQIDVVYSVTIFKIQVGLHCIRNKIKFL